MRPPSDPVSAAYDTRATLPVASPGTIRAYLRALMNRHRRGFGVVVVLQAVAAVSGLVGPVIIGSVVATLAAGATSENIDRAALLFLAALVVQAVFTRMARLRGGILGEEILADLREDFLARCVMLPPGVVERSGTGDLLTRTTTDIDRLSRAVRDAVPELAIAAVTALFALVALVVAAPALAPVALLGAPVLVVSSRWYFGRAPVAYRAEAATYAGVNTVIAESVDAGRTVEAYRLGPARVERTDAAIRTWISWERYTLWLRMMWFPCVDASYVLALAGVLGAGGAMTMAGWIGVGQLTAAVLYTQMLIEPVDLILAWYDELQVGQASLARLVGVREVPLPTASRDLEPDGEDLAVDHVRFGYRPGQDVLHDITMQIPPGTRVALVGPSGAGKSTLGRLMAGIYAPRRGDVTVGGASLSVLAPEDVRQHVALVTQEHHVFRASLRDNLRLARPEAAEEDLWSALDSVDAASWAASLPDGLDTAVGGGGLALTPAQAQQLALARLVVADPHTLVLDEATSLMDPRAARHLERSLSAVLHGRTVVAIAHRLHTAHDADVIAVVVDGAVTEQGRHRDLVAAGGAYARLWRSWHGDPPAEDHLDGEREPEV